MKLPYILISITAICALVQQPDLQEFVIWNRDFIHEGQWWRIVTGNFTHTNFYHFVMNMAALWIITLLFNPKAKSITYSLVIISSVVGTSLLFSNLYIYAGLSGVLHGLFVFYAFLEIFNGRKSSCWLIIGVSLKIIYEQLYGASPQTAKLIAAEVATEAHLIGAITGVILAIFVFILCTLTPRTFK